MWPPLLMVSIPRALGSSSSNSGYILCPYDINGGRMLCAPLLDRKETGWYFTKGGKVSFRTMSRNLVYFLCLICPRLS